MKLLATLILFATITLPLHAQSPQWEYIPSPTMSAYAQAVSNSTHSVFYSCAGHAIIATLPCTFAHVDMNVPQEELAQLRIALDDSTRPWMISDQTFYRPMLVKGRWNFTSEPRTSTGDPVFFTLTPADKMFISDPAGAALRSIDLGQSWQHVGPAGIASARGILDMPDASLLLWTEQQLYNSVDGGENWSELAIPTGINTIRSVYADGHGIVLNGLRDAAPFLARIAKPGDDWEIITPTLQAGEVIREVSGYNGAVLLLVEGPVYPFALHLTAGASNWQKINGLPMATRQYTYFGDGYVRVARPNALDQAQAPGADIRPWFGAGNVTDSNPMLCVDEQTFVVYKHEDGFYRSTDRGLHWTETLDFESSWSYELFYGASHTNMYCVFYSDMFLSNDGGASWKHTTLPGSYYSPHIAEAETGEVYLVGRNDDSVIRSTDFGTSWTEVRSKTGRYIFPPLHAIDGRLYLLLNDSMFVSSDKGVSWTHDSEFHITVQPSKLFMFDSDLIFAVYNVEDRMDLSTDMGRSWRTVTPSDGTTFYDMQRLPNSSTIYGYASCCGSNLYMSTDNGKSWRVIIDDVAECISKIRLSPQGYLMASTSGGYRSHFLWRKAAVLSALNVPAPQQLAVSAWPQPVVSGANLQVETELRTATNLRLELYDLLGNLHAVQQKNDVTRGRHRFTLPTHGLPVGMYFLRLQTRDGVAIKKLLISSATP